MRLQPILIGFVVLALLPGVAMGLVSGNPDLSVSLSDDTVEPGTEPTLELTLVNQGDLDTGSSQPTLNEEVMTARGVRVSVDASDAPFDVETGSQSFGQLAPGTTRSPTFQLSVPEDATPGSYTLPVTVSYSHTAEIWETSGWRETEDSWRTFDVTVHVRETPQFRVTDVTHDVQAGSSGTVSLTLSNVGSATANETAVNVQSKSGDIAFGETQSATRFVGDWAPDETRTLTYEVTAAPDTASQAHALTATANYEFDDGADGTSEPLDFSLRPRPEQQFAVESVDTDVAVGKTGDVAVTLRNTGPTTVRQSTVTLEPTHTDLQFGNAANATLYVGEWAPNETRTLTYRLTVADRAESRSYAATATVAYQHDNGDAQQYRIGSVGVTPAPEHDDIVVEPVATTLRFDASNSITVQLGNAGDERLTDVQAHLAVEPPYESNSPTAYVSSLSPGDNETVTLELTTPEDDVPSTDAVSLNVTAETPDGREVLYGPYLVPVSTAAASGGVLQGFPILGLGAIVVVGLVALGWWRFN